MSDQTAAAGTTQDTSTSLTAAVPPADAAATPVVPATEVPATNEPKTDAAVDDKAIEKVAEPKVPEVYDFKLPEGVKLDDAAVDIVTPVLKELGVGNEGAQKLATAFMSIQADQAARQSAQWLADAKADKEIGGAKWDATTKAAQSAFAEFATPELKNFLDSTGLGNHPGLIKAFAKIAERSAQDKHVPADANVMETDPAKRLFPNTK
jgi:hypothetical protein